MICDFFHFIYSACFKRRDENDEPIQKHISSEEFEITTHLIGEGGFGDVFIGNMMKKKMMTRRQYSGKATHGYTMAQTYQRSHKRQPGSMCRGRRADTPPTDAKK